MARVKPFRRLEIDAQICTKLTDIIEEKRYRGSFTSFVESILDLYADGLLKDVRDTTAPFFETPSKKPIVTTTRVRAVGEISKGEDHRKAS